MDAFTLFELNEHIRRVVALNFEAPVWIQCEISQIKESRGNYYLELIDKDEETDQVIAQSAATIWARTYWSLKKKLGDSITSLLQDGVELKIKVTITFHERYGLKLNIVDIDPAFTMGQLEIKRLKIIEKLQKENRLEKNAELDLPSVVQRIAVISSETAAGYQDFVQQLKLNNYGYAFDCRLFQSAVQGSNVEPELIKRLQQINKNAGHFDCIIIIRGGGARLDLSGFDNYNIAVAVSESKLPVLVGIGHDIDSTVLDLVGHTSLKTPTATADFLIDHNLQFEGSIEQLSKWLELTAKRRTDSEAHFLQNVLEAVSFLPMQILARAQTEIESHFPWLNHLSGQMLQQHTIELEQFEKILNILDPVQILAKGYSITRSKGKILKSVEDVLVEDEIETVLFQGSIISKIESIVP